MNELVETQGRTDELGCKMVKFVTSPGMLSTTSPRVSAQAVSTGSQTNSSFAIHAQTNPSITVPLPFSPTSHISSYGYLRRCESVLHRKPTITSAVRNGRLHISLGPHIRRLPACTLPATSSLCSCWSAAGADGRHLGGCDRPAVPENKFNNPTLLRLVTPLSPHQRARRTLLRYARRLGLKAFDSDSHLAWYRALYIPIATMDRHLAPHPVNPLRSICS
jgi:hypothetical protein